MSCVCVPPLPEATVHVTNRDRLAPRGLRRCICIRRHPWTRAALEWRQQNQRRTYPLYRGSSGDGGLRRKVVQRDIDSGHSPAGLIRRIGATGGDSGELRLRSGRCRRADPNDYQSDHQGSRETEDSAYDAWQASGIMTLNRVGDSSHGDLAIMSSYLHHSAPSRLELCHRDRGRSRACGRRDLADDLVGPLAHLIDDARTAGSRIITGARG